MQTGLDHAQFQHRGITHVHTHQAINKSAGSVREALLILTNRVAMYLDLARNVVDESTNEEIAAFSNVWCKFIAQKLGATLGSHQPRRTGTGLPDPDSVHSIKQNR
jgi:hypothetical protein